MSYYYPVKGSTNSPQVL